MYAEATFVCPSYWINDAYVSEGRGSWHYQYSVPFAAHGDDVYALFGPAMPNQPPAFNRAVRNLWRTLIQTGRPTIDPTTYLNGAPPNWSGHNSSLMLNLNITGGAAYEATTLFGVNVTQFQEPGLKNDFKMVRAYPWESGRGARCDFWRSLGDRIPI